MRYDSRLFNAPRLRAAAEICDDLANHAGEVTDALADYETAEEAGDKEEVREAREDAREEAWQGVQEILAAADRLRAWSLAVLDKEREL